MKTPPEPKRSAALPNSQLELIYYIGKFSLNSLEVRGHPFEGCLYISIRPGQIIRYPLPVPELLGSRSELPEPEVPDPKFG
jgi:hypothetical protein